MLWTFIRKNNFIILLLLFVLLLSTIMVKWDPVNRYGFFYQNDFSRTVHTHPPRPWPSIFFGSSIVTGSYREDKTTLDMVNVGMDYGKVTDLERLLEDGYLKGTRQILLGVNYMTLMDNLPTNPYYQWHRKFYVPYIFFYRTPIREYLERDLKALIKGEPLFQIGPYAYHKELYFGFLTKEQLQQKVESYHKRFGKETISDFQKNLQSLRRVIEYCHRNGIELKAIWMPVNPVYELPQYAKDVKVQAQGILNDYNVETIDWTSRFGPEYFHDLVHMEWDKGGTEFTKELEKWLAK